MTQKDLSRTPKETLLSKRHVVQSHRRKKISSPAPTSHILVRAQEEIPQSVLDFFQADPRTGQAYREEERLFFSQVLMHEIDEGIRTLLRAKRFHESKAIGDFSNKIHLTNRLDHIRRVLEEIEVNSLPPERVHGSYKARNNQWGAIKTRIGNHPALAMTEMGVGYKECNEDAYLLMGPQKILALADGMGGHAGGNIASGVAIDFFEFAIGQGMELESAISFANDAIIVRSKSDPRLGGMHPMGCTFAAVQLKNGNVKVCHVGDTKVLVVREGKIIFQSEDHTQGQQLLSEGLVDHTTAFELNHILNRCLGLDAMQPQRDVACTVLDLLSNDRVFIFTDGITDNFFDDHFNLPGLAEILMQGSLNQAADLLLDQCHQLMVNPQLPNGRPSKPDNIALAMLEYRG